MSAHDVVHQAPELGQVAQGVQIMVGVN